MSLRLLELTSSAAIYRERSCTTASHLCLQAAIQKSHAGLETCSELCHHTDPRCQHLQAPGIDLFDESAIRIQNEPFASGTVVTPNYSVDF